ncbi:MAG: SH3 domain-containing protein [Gemmatimonadales bacterium]
MNVREGRGTDTPIIQILDPGQPVEVDSLQGRWWGLYIDGKHIGYVANSVLQNESPGR